LELIEFYLALLIGLVGILILIFSGYLTYRGSEFSAPVLSILGMGIIMMVVNGLLPFEFSKMNDFVATILIVTTGFLSLRIAYSSGKYFERRRDKRTKMEEYQNEIRRQQNAYQRKKEMEEMRNVD
jgi:hypothetical protein